MKRLVLTLAICLGCIGILGAQNVWKPIDVSAAFLGAAPDGGLYFNCGYSGIGRSQDEGETLQIVLGYETGNDYYFNEYCFSVSPEGRIFVFEDNPFRAWYSDDYGDTWQHTSDIPLSAGDKAWNLYALNNGTLVGSTEYGSVFWTTDGGNTWGMNTSVFEDEFTISDILVNENGDVYISLYYYGNGLYHSTLSDMQNWELVAFEGLGIFDMELDPEGNLVCAGYGDEFSGFEQIPGFYALEAKYISISDDGIVYTINYHDDDDTEGLAYSLDHGEHFTEIGERMYGVRPQPNCCIPMKWLIKGFDNHLYYLGLDQYYKSIRDADHILNNDYFPLVHEGNNRQKWNVVYIGVTPNYPNDYHTEIQSIRDDITLDGVDYKIVWTKSKYGIAKAGAVREEDRRVYYRRKISQNYQDEVLLYDFNLNVGDTVTVNWMGQQLMVMEESEVEVDGTMRRQLGLGAYSIGYPPTEVDEYWIEGVGSTFGFLNSGSEGMGGAFITLLCYHENGNLIWDNEEFDECVMNSDGAPATFAPQGAEWYFHVWSQGPITEPPFYYIRHAVTGEAEVQGHLCSVIDGYRYVYEEDGVVYMYNHSTDAFTVMYDFNAEEGDTWYCDIEEGFTCLVTVESVDSVTWNGHTYRTQYVTGYIPDEGFLIYDGRIIEGIGYEKGLFPHEYVIDGTEYAYMRCYLEDGELLYHEGDVDCDWEYVNTFCWDGTVAEAYAGGDGTEENPYQIANAQQLALLAQQTNNGTGGDAYYRLTANINLEKCTGGSIAWTSIGIPENDTTPRYFTGHFDGGGNNILNLYQRHDATFKGLFGCTNGAEIKDVNLVYCEIGNGSEYAGGLVAYAGSTDISNCSVQNSQITTTGGVAGGIVGYAGMPFRNHETNENISRITNCEIDLVTVESAVAAGGIVGKINDDACYARYLVSHCSANNELYHHVKGIVSGGIVGEMRYGTVEGCASKTIVVGTGQVSNVCVGGIAGSIHGSSVIANSYNRGNVVADFEFAGGIVGYSAGNVYNVYNAGEIYMPDPNSSGYGTIIGNVQAGERLNCYWLENGLPSAGNLILPDMPGSTSFHQGSTATSWVLNESQYGTSDLLEALNLGPHDEFIWLEDVGMTNGGLPIPMHSEASFPLHGSEWYYEILNDDGSITYQYMYQSGDTIVQDEPTQILVKINTLYDKGSHQEVTREYVYERDGKVYWWNKTLEEFTVLYDLGAQEGDEWEIKVGTESITMHVDAVEQYEYEGRTYKLLQVSDEGDIFSGTIVCGIGHLTSFFPERLLTRNKGYRVEGIRCYWREGELVFKYGDKDCDEVYQEYHNGLDESNENQFNIYPNPTKGILFVETRHGTSLPDQTYRITNLMGQILLTGQITAETQQIDVAALPKGMYFITVAGETRKFVVR